MSEDTPLFPPLASREKRIVLKHPSGLHQILAVCPEQPDALLPFIRVDGLETPINLVAVKPRYYLFKTVQMAAQKKTFDRAQQ